jgi:hypothetical protein
LFAVSESDEVILPWAESPGTSQVMKPIRILDMGESLSSKILHGRHPWPERPGDLREFENTLKMSIDGRLGLI